MIRSLFARCIIIILFLFLNACGGGSGSSTPSSGESNTITGTALAPSGSIAQLDQEKPFLLATLDFVMRPSWAAVTGLTPVPNTIIELIRIDDDGGQLGAVLATTTTNSNGEYSLDLPTGVEPQANLVVQIKNNANAPVLRALVIGDTVNIDPVSQFILNTLINEPGLVLANLNIASVQNLVTQIEAITIDLSSITSLESAATAIGSSTEISQVVSQQIDIVSNTSFIVGAWGEGADIQMAVFYPNGFYINYKKDNQDCINGGVEYGSYGYDGTTLTITPAVDQNGICGFSKNSATASYPVDFSSGGNQLNLTSFDPDTQTNVTASFPRVNDNNPDSIVGGWNIGGNLAQPQGIVYYPNGTYIHWQNSTSDVNCAPGGVEYGTYSYNGTVLSGTIVHDENNDCGMGLGPGTFSLDGITVSSNQLSFNEEFIFDRMETSSASGNSASSTNTGSSSGTDIVSLNMTPSNAVALNRPASSSSRYFLPELLGENSLQAQYGNGFIETLSCTGHHYNPNLQEHILHCMSPSNGAAIYLGLTSSNSNVITFEYQDAGAYFMSYWVPVSTGTTQITGTLQFANTPVSFTVNVNLNFS